MIQNVIIVLPGLAALIVCLRRGPERALLDVYLPTLLLLPQAFTWTLSGELPFADTAILPIGLFFLFRPQREWEWSSIDFLVIAHIAITVVAEGINLGYKKGQNLALQEFCSVFLPYFAVKQIIGRQQFAVAFAKRIVVLLTIVAIISVYEFRMGSNLFVRPFVRIFFEPPNTAVFRAGFKRIQGPYGHAIAAGVMMAIGYRIARWLDWSGTWSGRMRLLPISKIRFCELWILAGSIMTISVGPWLGAAGGAVAVAVCRARNRKRALALVIFAIVVVGPPVHAAFKAYISVDRNVAVANGDRLQEDSAYRNKLLAVYIPVVDERPTWGYGRKGFPVMEGMGSIDNNYLLIALTFGLYALGLLLAILVWSPIRLCAFGLMLPGRDPAALAAFTLMGIYVLIAISMGTVAMDGGQAGRFFFLVNGWSAGLLKSGATEKARAESTAPRPHTQFAFRRVMA
jgi:hypothetical protein